MTNTEIRRRFGRGTSPERLELVDGHAESVAGRRRPQNEDKSLIVALRPPAWGEASDPAAEAPFHLLAVADGMGGAPAGELASALALEEFERRVAAGIATLTGDRHAGEFEALLEEAIWKCQAALEADAAAHPDRAGMGTTLTAVLAHGGRIHVAHVGDSRAYLCREGLLQRLTTDHTYAEKLAAAGVLDRKAIPASRWKHVMWNIVGGTTPSMKPEIASFDLRSGDAVLVCTDGLTDVIDDERLATECSGSAGAADVCRALVAAAQEENAGDDITVIFARFRRR
jgi:protein phosphatase